MGNRVFWNTAPYADRATNITRMRATAAFDDVIERLKAIAKDPKGDPDEREAAEEMLSTMSTDREEPQARRAKAEAAHKEVKAKRVMDAQMTQYGLQVHATKRISHMEGVRQVIPTMTPKEARAYLASKASKGGAR